MSRVGAVGLGLAVTSAATFGTSGTFGAALMDAGWTPVGAIAMRVGVATLVLTIPALLALRGRWNLLRRSSGAVLAFGVAAIAGAQLCYFNAVEHLSVGVALLLEYSGTLLVVLWMWVRHGQRPRRLTMIGGALAIAGLVLVLDITGSQRVDVVGVVWALGAAVGLACYFVISAQNEDVLPPVVTAWAGMAVGAVILFVVGLSGALPFAMSTRDVSFAGTTTSWLVPALGLSVVAAAFAYVTGIGAARRLGARIASFVGLAEVLFAILFAWLLLDQKPSWSQLIGGVIVLAGIALVRADDREPAAAVLESDVPVPA